MLQDLDRSIELRSWILLVVLQFLEGLWEIAAGKSVVLRASTGVEVKVLSEEGQSAWCRNTPLRSCPRVADTTARATFNMLALTLSVRGQSVSASRGHSCYTRSIATRNAVILGEISVYLLRATQAHVGPPLRLAT